MEYTEKRDDSKGYKQEYVDGLFHVIEARQKEAEVFRKEYVKNILNEPETYRQAFKRMLGWPLVDYQPNDLPKVVCEKLSEEDGYHIYRMHFEILDGLRMTGLFFQMESEKPQPLVIVQHGGEGTPEHIAGVYGDTTNYNDMLHRVRQQGVHVFAPQLLLWKQDRYEVAYDRSKIDAHLKRVGSSIAAIEVFGIMRILDYFEAQEFVTEFGMVGLSYGGFYTLFTAAADTRIKASLSCSFFNSRDKYPQADWTWPGEAYHFNDAEVAALIYPRKFCVQMGDHDPLFDYHGTVQSFERLKELTGETDWLEEQAVFDGTHEFCKDDVLLKNVIGVLKA